jgi:hypothetical protein
MLVTHLTHGVGTIVNERGTIEVFHGETTWNCASCARVPGFSIAYSASSPTGFCTAAGRNTCKGCSSLTFRERMGSDLDPNAPFLIKTTPTRKP